MVIFPRSRVETLIPLPFIFFTTVQLPAVVILGYWFLIQFLSGLGSLSVRGAGGVAWWAHVGGFLLGAMVAGLVGRRR
jgi:membrane associated rhomboid family serine protease